MDHSGRPVDQSAQTQHSGRLIRRDRSILRRLQRVSPTSGPAVTFTGLMPDLDHYKGSFGGRAFPLWRDARQRSRTSTPRLLVHSGESLRPAGQGRGRDGLSRRRDGASGFHGALQGRSRSARPARAADGGCKAVRRSRRARLRSDLAALLRRALRRCRSRPAEAGRRACRRKARRPSPRRAQFPARPSRCPTRWITIPATRRLQIGKGYVENVTPEMWAYEVSGKQVLWHWFSYRRRDRSRPIIGDRRPPSPLDNIQPDHWLPEYTSDLAQPAQRARPA